MMIKKGLKPRLQEIPARKIPIKRGFSKFFREESKRSRLKLDLTKTKNYGFDMIDTFRIRKRENSFDQNKVPSVQMNKPFNSVRFKR